MTLAVNQLIGFGAFQVDIVGGADGIGRIPTMTSGTTSGVTITDGGNGGAGVYEGWRIGDKSNASRFLGPVTTTPSTVTIDFGSALTIYTYEITTGNAAHYSTAWTLRGSTDNFASSDVVLDTQTGQGALSAFSFSIASPGSYRYYRLRSTAYAGSYTGFDEVQLKT